MLARAGGRKLGGGGEQQGYSAADGKYTSNSGADGGAAATAKAAPAEAFADIADRHRKVRIEMSHKRFADQPTWAIDRLEVAAGERGQGLAGAALRDITDYADAASITLALTPEQTGGTGGLSTAALREWYARHGFVKNGGKYPDISEAMVRPPEDQTRAAAGAWITRSEPLDAELAEAPAGALIVRSSAQLDVAGVRFEQREMDLLAVPFGVTEHVVTHGYAHSEEFDPGAFDGIERRANRVKALRDHKLERVVGRAKVIRPTADGLLATLRISRTPLGDETLELAADGALDPSVGFAPMPGGDVWNPQRTHVKRIRAWLGEISLTPMPAYAGAGVLAVRHGELLGVAPTDDVRPVAPPGGSATPLLDDIARRMLRLQLDSGNIPGDE